MTSLLMALLLCSDSLIFPKNCLPELTSFWTKADTAFNLIIHFSGPDNYEIIRNPIKDGLKDIEPLLGCSFLRQYRDNNNSLYLILEWRYGKGWVSGSLITDTERFSLKIPRKP